MTDFNSLQTLLDHSLIKEQAKRKDRVRSGKFSPSSFGKCYRSQIWNRANVEITNPPPVETLRIWAIGHLFHNWMQSVLPKHETEVKIEDIDILGFADVVFPDTVEDIKTIRSYGWNKINKVGYDITKDKMEEVLQVVWYAGRIGKKMAKIIKIEKDGCKIKEFLFFVEEHIEDVRKELKALRAYWKIYKMNEILPPAEPRTYGGKECKYCGFSNKCQILEKEISNATTNNKK